MTDRKPAGSTCRFCGREAWSTRKTLFLLQGRLTESVSEGHKQMKRMYASQLLWSGNWVGDRVFLSAFVCLALTTFLIKWVAGRHYTAGRKQWWATNPVYSRASAWSKTRSNEKFQEFHLLRLEFIKFTIFKTRGRLSPFNQIPD